MVHGKVLLCLFVVAALQCMAWGVALPRLHFPAVAVAVPASSGEGEVPGAVRARVREGVPPPLCAGRCRAPRVGPVCAFDAAGTARTFATLCDLEAASCKESTFYAVSSRGEC